MIPLPEEYISYIQNGGAVFGETDYEFGGYFDLEPLELVQQYNTDIEIEQYAPDFIAFGSDGGGEAFVFDSKGAVYLLPLIGMEQDQAVKIANSWKEFISHVSNVT